jgi:hypothetical protein
LDAASRWHVWQNTDGQTEAIRAHNWKFHAEEWVRLVIAEKLKGWEMIEAKLMDYRRQSTATAQTGKPCEGFTLERFYERLVRWVAVDDQVS